MAAKKTQTYVLMSGEAIEYEASPAETDYLARLRIAAQDPCVSTRAMVGLLYSVDNPLLETGVIPGLGVVTRRVFDNPLYHVMLDQVYLKWIQLSEADTDEVGCHFTMSVSDAAERLGVSTSAVRQAVYSKRLAGRKVDGKWMVDPAAVDVFKVSNRGPAPPLEVVMGSAPGLSFSVAADTELERDERGSGGEVVGRYRGWTEAAVKSVRKSDNNIIYWELRPAGEEAEISLDNFSVRGRFQVVRKESDNKRANEAFKGFRARRDGARDV